MKVKCVKCGKNGSLTMKTTISKGKTYRYFYVEHSEKRKKSWCYIGKELPGEYARAGYTKDTQTKSHFCVTEKTQKRSRSPNSVRNLEPRAGIEPATAALPRRCPTRLGYRGPENDYCKSTLLYVLNVIHS
jgi:hypothetical protein